VAFGPDNIFAIGQANGKTLLWSTASKSVITTLADPDHVIIGSVAFGPDNTLAVGDDNGNTYLWHISSGRS
jgi:WD40 repeat protein